MFQTVNNNAILGKSKGILLLSIFIKLLYYGLSEIVAYDIEQSQNSSRIKVNFTIIIKIVISK